MEEQKKFEVGSVSGVLCGRAQGQRRATEAIGGCDERRRKGQGMQPRRWDDMIAGEGKRTRRGPLLISAEREEDVGAGAHGREESFYHVECRREMIKLSSRDRGTSWW